MKRVFINQDMSIGSVLSGSSEMIELNTVRPCNYIDVDDIYFFEQGDYFDAKKSSIVNSETKKEFKVEKT